MRPNSIIPAKLINGELVPLVMDADAQTLHVYRTYNDDSNYERQATGITYMPQGKYTPVEWNCHYCGASHLMTTRKCTQCGGPKR